MKLLEGYWREKENFGEQVPSRERCVCIRQKERERIGWERSHNQTAVRLRTLLLLPAAWESWVWSVPVCTSLAYFQLCSKGLGSGACPSALVGQLWVELRLRSSVASEFAIHGEAICKGAPRARARPTSTLRGGQLKEKGRSPGNPVCTSGNQAALLPVQTWARVAVPSKCTDWDFIRITWWWLRFSFSLFVAFNT